MTAGRSKIAASVLALVGLLGGGCCCTCPGVSTNSLLLLVQTPASAENSALRAVALEHR
jgi:hypothetical protein